MPEQPAILTPPRIPAERFADAEAALARLALIYDTHTAFLRDQFRDLLRNGTLPARVRATYPEVLIETSTYAQIDSRLSYGHVAGPGVYATTITQPGLFHGYLLEQLRLLIRNHGVTLEVGPSAEPIPLHFAFPDGIHVEGELSDRIERPLRDLFDVPDLTVMDDAIANGTYEPPPGEAPPLALFTAPRVDYSLQRLRHYTGTAPEHFQNFVIFTNYQFYIDEFIKLGAPRWPTPTASMRAFVEPGNVVTPHHRPPRTATVSGMKHRRACRRCRPTTSPAEDRSGITMVNIGVGPVQRQDHHRPHRRAAPACLAHARPLRRACATARRWATTCSPTPTCAKTTCSTRNCPPGCRSRRWPRSRWRSKKRWPTSPASPGYELKRIMRTGTVATIDNRNWELRDHAEPVQLLAVARGGARHGDRPPSPPTASASACPTAPCSASPTSRCMAS
jgi:AMP nucleosidase